jgi:tetratricopeptide (TPR) repeat protein
MSSLMPMRSVLLCILTGLLLLTGPRGWARDTTNGASLSVANVETKPARDPLSDVLQRAMAAQVAKKFDQALALFEQASSLADRRSRPMSWLTIQFNLCHTLSLKGNKEAAAALARQIVRDCETCFGSGDPLTSEALSHLAFVLKQQGRLAEAEPVYRRNVRLLEAKYGEDHFLVANAVCRHGGLLQNLGRLKEAEDQLRRAFEIAEVTTNSAGDPADHCFYATHLAHCLHAGGKTEEARNLMDSAYELVRQLPDQALNFGGSILRRQAEYYRDIRKLDRAEELARRGLLRLALRADVNRAKFYYYDFVTEVYRSVLRAKSMNEAEIEAAVRQVEQDVAREKATGVPGNVAAEPAS